MLLIMLPIYLLYGGETMRDVADSEVRSLGRPGRPHERPVERTGCVGAVAGGLEAHDLQPNELRRQT